MTALPATVLTDRFTRAVDYARIAHAAQVRKGTTIPYLTHLLGVAALVIEHGGSEDQAIAGLLQRHGVTDIDVWCVARTP